MLVEIGILKKRFWTDISSNSTCPRSRRKGRSKAAFKSCKPNEKNSKFQFAKTQCTAIK